VVRGRSGTLGGELKVIVFGDRTKRPANGGVFDDNQRTELARTGSYVLVDNYSNRCSIL
jgi:hypothetical protein